MKNLSLKSYVIGFVGSLILTLTAYGVTIMHIDSGHVFPPDAIAASILIALALIQFAWQMRFFLHLGIESKPRWKLLVFWFMLLVVAILVFGSLWIMHNLNYRMTPQQINNYMNAQGGF